MTGAKMELADYMRGHPCPISPSPYGPYSEVYFKISAIQELNKLPFYLTPRTDKPNSPSSRLPQSPETKTQITNHNNITSNNVINIHAISGANHFSQHTTMKTIPVIHSHHYTNSVTK